MTKADEMAVLDAAIAKLGMDSYLGPFLKGIRDQVERDIRSDIMPDYTPAMMEQQAKVWADTERSLAKREAFKIIQNAETNAAEIRLEATAERDHAAKLRIAAGRDRYQALDWCRQLVKRLEEG